VVQTVTTVASSVLLPALAFVRQEPERFRSVCLRATGLAGLVFAPALAAFIAVPDVVLVLLYGGRWAPAADVLRIIALPYLAFGTMSAFTAIFPALGRADLLLRWQVLSGLLLFGGAAVGAWFGTLSAIAYGQLALLLVIGPRIAAAAGLVGMKLRDYLRALRGPVLAGVGAGLAVALVRYALGERALIILAPALIATGVISYVGLAVGARLDAVRDIRQLISRS
jgi:O-antigen/teichoic acid export membrane protein